MVGTGVAGVCVTSLRAVLQLVLPGKENMFTLALIFFALGTTFLWLCAYLYNPLYRNPFFLHYLHRSEGEEVLLEEGRLNESPTSEQIEQREKP